MEPGRAEAEPRLVVGLIAVGRRGDGGQAAAGAGADAGAVLVLLNAGDAGHEGHARDVVQLQPRAGLVRRVVAQGLPLGVARLKLQARGERRDGGAGFGEFVGVESDLHHTHGIEGSAEPV